MGPREGDCHASWGNRMTGKKEYGVGLLGCGFIGKVHMYCHTVLPYYYDSLPFRSRFVGVCTSREETARNAEDQLGFQFGTTDAEEVIRCPEVDVVHVCTPNSLHKDELVEAMAAGKHIYCDKPLVPDLAEARAVLDAMRGYSGTHQMTLQYRFFPATMRAKQLAEEGFLGDITCFRAAYLHSGSIDPDKRMAWKLDAGKGGGVLNDLASHVVDLMQHLIGPFQEVFAATRILHAQRPSPEDPAVLVPVQAEDHVCMIIKNDDGLVGTVEASKLSTGTQDELRFEIHGTKGAMRFDLMSPNWLEIYELGSPSEPIGGRRGFTRVECVQRYPRPGGSFPAPKGSIGWVRGHVACLYNFMSALHEGRKAEPGLEVGAELNRFVEAAKLSERKGRFVDVASL